MYNTAFVGLIVRTISEMGGSVTDEGYPKSHRKKVFFFCVIDEQRRNGFLLAIEKVSGGFINVAAGFSLIRKLVNALLGLFVNFFL